MPGEVVMASMSAAAAEDDDEEQGSCFIWSSLLHAPPESVLFGRARYTSESGTWYLRLKTGLKKQKTKKQMLVIFVVNQIKNTKKRSYSVSRIMSMTKESVSP